MRLDKFLADCGLGTRSQVKSILKSKKVKVNGKLETSGKLQVAEKSDQVTYDGRLLTYSKFLYYLMNKPQGVISAREDKEHQTVLDLLGHEAKSRGVFPVGRLDKDTRGLLLLTNNGDLAHAMLSPKRHVDKTYEAQVAGIMTEEDRLAFARGLQLKDFTCQPATLEIVEKSEQEETCLVKISISEGKFHQVKRMVAACGKEVLDLKRLSMGPLTLDSNLAEGSYRFLTDSELASLATYGLEV